MSGLVLAGANVIRRDGSVEGPCDIAVRSGRIEAVSPAGQFDRAERAAVPGFETINCSGMFVSPGLVNLHTHSPMTLFRGMAEDVSIEDWFNARIWPYESRLKPSDVNAGSLLAIAEMIDAGVTAFFDHYFMADQIVAAAEATGIRADIAPTVFGFGDWRKELDDSAALVEDVNRRGGLVKARIGPHSPYICSPEVLRACVNRAEQLGVGTHLHMSETEKQVQDSLVTHGKTPYEVAHDAGIMETGAIFAHGAWMTARDATLVSKRSFMAVAPKTYLKLSSGVENLYRVLICTGYGKDDSPITVGIGTDGAASSNTLNPLEQARLFALLGKDRSSDATAFTKEEVWRILMNGHDALEAGTGDVAEGFVADLVIWDLRFAATWPVTDPLAAILYSADSRNVRDVLVHGRFLKRSGVLQTLDVNDVIDRAAAVRDRLWAEGAGQAKVKY